MTKGKEIMKRVKGKLQSKPADQQSSLKFKEFLRQVFLMGNSELHVEIHHKIKVLETDKKEVVGVFGKTGAEIPKLQEFLRNLNDRRTKISDYVSGAYGILSLIQGAKSSDITDSKEVVCQVPENNLKEGLETIGQSIDEAYEAFEQCLSLGVRQSVDSCEKIAKDKVIEPKGKKGSGYHKVLKTLCKKNGVYKPIRKKGQKRQRERNINDSLASCMRGLSNETFKKYFPNQGKDSSINYLIDNFTLDTNRLVEKHPEVLLLLTFLKTEETKLKAKLKRDIRERKKEIYNILLKSISNTMHPCYERAAQYTGTDRLENMRKELRNHLKESKGEMFNKAKKEMLDLLKEM
ncbi:unnamed protein product, partial [Coregonus sp. 'balchen']